MANENENVQTEETKTVEQEYLEQIEQLKSSTVSKEEYDKLKNQHTALLKSYVNGTANVEAEKQKEVEVKSADDVRKELFKPERELNDIEYVQKALELREKVMNETGFDCFTPGPNATQDDIANAAKTAQVLQDCLDKADGNNAQFITALQSKLVDVSLPRQAASKRPGGRA